MMTIIFAWATLLVLGAFVKIGINIYFNILERRERNLHKKENKST